MRYLRNVAGLVPREICIRLAAVPLCGLNLQKPSAKQGTKTLSSGTSLTWISATFSEFVLTCVTGPRDLTVVRLTCFVL